MSPPRVRGSNSVVLGLGRAVETSAEEGRPAGADGSVGEPPALPARPGARRRGAGPSREPEYRAV